MGSERGSNSRASLPLLSEAGSSWSMRRRLPHVDTSSVTSRNNPPPRCSMDSGPVVQDTATAATVTVHTSPTVELGAATVPAAAPDWGALLAQSASQTSVATDTTAAAGECENGVQSGDWMSRINRPRFNSNGKYITGYVDSSADLFKLLEDYSALTGTQFPNIQQLSLATKASEQDYLQQRFLTPSARPRLFWQMHAGEPVIPFDGVPFISVGQGTEIPCVLAGRRKTTTQVLVATGDVLPTKIHTQGCNAKVSIRRILRYPSGRLPDTGVQGITALRRLRKQMLEVLTAKICAGSVNPMERFYFSLPTPLAHDSHSVPEIEDPPSLIEPVHDEILNQIGQKITSVGHIDSHVRKFVETTYGEDPSINIQDPTFLPSRYDLMRYIYWLYRSGRAVDPECLFRERYSLLNEENEPDKQQTQSQTETTPTTTPSTAVVKHADTPHPDHALSNIYNIVLGNDGGGAMELGGAQLGAEETASTTSTSSLPGLASTHQESVKIVSSGSRLVAAPKSMIFTPPQRGTEQASDQSSSMASQSQADIRSMLQIIENQTYACHDLNALQTLRRQLTVLCTEFSMHLAGTPKRTNEPSLMSIDNKRQKLN